MEAKERDWFFDNAKFILIFLVVLGHAMETIVFPSSHIIYRFIYLFHMPAFVFIAGYFTKSKKQPKIGKLLLLYVILQTIHIVLFSSDIKYLYPQWTLWFLLALVIWKIITPYISQYKPYITLPVVVVIALLAGYDSSIDDFLTLSRVIVFYPFFLIGHYFDKKYIEMFKRTWAYILSVCIIIGSVIVIYLIPDMFPIQLLWGSFPYSLLGFTEWWAFSYRLLAAVWGVLVTSAFFILIPNRKLFFSVLGRYTLLVYLIHGLVIKVLAYYCNIGSITVPWQIVLFYVLVILGTILLMLISLLFNKRRKTDTLVQNLA